MAEHFQGTAESLFKGMDNFVTTKTCVGDPIHVGDTIILPLMDVSFGMMASSKNEEKRSNGGGGMGGKMTPAALLVIKDGSTRLIKVHSDDSLSRIIDMVPDIVSRFTDKKVKTSAKEDKAMDEAAREEKKF